MIHGPAEIDGIIPPGQERQGETLMDKMRFETRDIVAGNIDKIAELFPAAVTEMRGEDGQIKKGINFEVLKQLLSQRLTPCGSQCGQCVCKCDCGDCCCTAGVLSQLSDSNLSRKATLAAGLLVLQGATLLGTLGNVLVLANDTAQRIYFVCASKVQFLG